MKPIDWNKVKHGTSLRCVMNTDGGALQLNGIYTIVAYDHYRNRLSIAEIPGGFFPHRFVLANHSKPVSRRSNIIKR